MINCKNCYHYHMCDLQYRLEEHQNCKHYIDKSLIVELPCKVGDTVYKVCDIESVHRQILEMEVLTIEMSNEEVVYLKTKKKYLYNFGRVTFDDFGKTVFLSREEAEKKLKEYKGE